MSRLDSYLVDNSLAPSRTKAQEMIEKGQVKVLVNEQFQVVKKPSFKMASEGQVQLDQTKLLKYVARSGLKLQYILGDLNLSPAGKKVLDIGLSTGGFAQCLLDHEALEVVGVDVGRRQLHSQLKHHPRLTSFEGINARYLRREWNKRGLNYQKNFDLITVDVSFISLKHILPEIPHFLAPRGEFLALVKPQFEKEKWGGKGAQGGKPSVSNFLLNSPLSSRGGFHKEIHGGDKIEGAALESSERKIYEDIKLKIVNICQSLQLSIKDCVFSRLSGRDGNREFFIYGRAQS